MKGGLHFYFFFSWVRFASSSFFTFSCLQHHVHIRHRRNYVQQKAVVAVCKHRYQGCQLNAKRACTREYLRDLGNLYSSAAYINF